MPEHSVLNPASPVTIFKCDHVGTPLISYPGHVVYADENGCVARCIWCLQKTYRLGSFMISQGDILIEFYYAQQWFNVFRVYSAAGRLKGWYCNITHPAILRQQEILWHDLALDLLVLPDRQRQVLDRDEFAALPLSDEDRQQAEAALTRLEQWASTCYGPFAAN